MSLQTHLFEDRVMKMSTLRGGRGHRRDRAIVLYDAVVGDGATLGALSLALKGEQPPRPGPAGKAFRPRPRGRWLDRPCRRPAEPPAALPTAPIPVLTTRDPDPHDRHPRDPDPGESPA